MFSKILLCLLFLLISGFNAYGYEIINSQTMVSPGYEGEIINQRCCTTPLINSIDGITASTYAKAYQNFNKGEEGLNSNHSYSINNNTNIEKIVKLEIKLSRNDGIDICQERNIRIPAYSAITASIDFYLSKEDMKTGCHEIYAFTTVSGDTSSLSRDTNTVNIK